MVPVRRARSVSLGSRDTSAIKLCMKKRFTSSGESKKIPSLSSSRESQKGAEPGATTLGSQPLSGGDLSYQATGWILEFSDSTLGSRLVLHSIAYHMNNDSGFCYPSLETIAKECRMTKAGVIQAVERLEDLGEVSVERAERPGAGSVNKYFMPLFAAWWVRAKEIDVKGKKGKPYYENGTKRVNRISEKGIRAIPEPLEPEREEEKGNELELTTPIKEDFGVVFKEMKSAYRRKTGKSIGSLGNYGEQFSVLVEKHTGDFILEVFKLWMEEQDKQFLKSLGWPFAFFMKRVNEHVESYQEKMEGESESEEGNDENLPRLERRS